MLSSTTFSPHPDPGQALAVDVAPNLREQAGSVAEAFLAKCLGGRAEPIGDDFAGASLQVLAGLEDVPGLAEAMKAKGG